MSVVAVDRVTAARTAVALSFLLNAFPGLSGGSQGLVLPTARVGIPGTGIAADLTEGVHYEIALVLLALAVGAFAIVSRSAR